MKNQTIMLKGAPDVIDTLIIDDLFIERMDKHSYYFRVGERIFYFSNPAKRGPGIELKEIT